MKKWGPKRDENHGEIMEELRKFCAVHDLSAVGMGVPDGIAWVCEAWRLFDIKNPKSAYGKKGLNKTQRKWIDRWPGGPVFLIYTVDEAKRFAHGDFAGLKRVESAESAAARRSA